MLPRRHQVSDQVFCAGILILAQQYDGGLHSRVLLQHSLNFPQFDAIPAYLHLMIHSPQKFDLSVGEIAYQVASAVEAGVGIV